MAISRSIFTQHLVMLRMMELMTAGLFYEYYLGTYGFSYVFMITVLRRDLPGCRAAARDVVVGTGILCVIDLE